MNVNQHEQDLKALRERLGEQRKVIYGLLALCIIGGLLFLKQIGNEKTIFVPPTVDKTFWVSKDRRERVVSRTDGKPIARRSFWT